MSNDLKGLLKIEEAVSEMELVMDKMHTVLRVMSSDFFNTVEEKTIIDNEPAYEFCEKEKNLCMIVYDYADKISSYLEDVGVVINESYLAAKDDCKQEGGLQQ